MPAQSFEASVLVASQQAADIFLLTVYLPPQYDKPKAGAVCALPQTPAVTAITAL